MRIDVKDKAFFINKKSIPSHFRQMGSITIGDKSGLLMMSEKEKGFFGLFNGEVVEINKLEVLILLGLAYIKYDPRIIASRGGKKGKGKKKRRSDEHYRKMQERKRLNERLRMQD